MVKAVFFSLLQGSSLGAGGKFFVNQRLTFMQKPVENISSTISKGHVALLQYSIIRLYTAPYSILIIISLKQHGNFDSIIQLRICSGGIATMHSLGIPSSFGQTDSTFQWEPQFRQNSQTRIKYLYDFSWALGGYVSLRNLVKPSTLFTFYDQRKSISQENFI